MFKSHQSVYSTLKIIIVFSLAYIVVTDATVSSLPKLNVRCDHVTLSGFSSGGNTAQQLLISYSSYFTGIGVFSHTYYRCGPGTGLSADYGKYCTQFVNTDTTLYYNESLALADIVSYYAQGIIENPADLAQKKLYIYAGTKNYLYSAVQAMRIIDVLGTYIPTDLIFTRVQEANDGLPSATFGGACDVSDSANFYINNCGLNGPHDALSFLLHPRQVTLPDSSVVLETLLTFDQTEFFTDGVSNYLDTEGYYYIPKCCTQAWHKCLLHFYFHGCNVGRQAVGDQHIVNSGYLELAEANGIIMVFPQSVNGTNNPFGCWDSYGFTGELYATQQGAQLNVLIDIVKRAIGE